MVRDYLNFDHVAANLSTPPGGEILDFEGGGCRIPPFLKGGGLDRTRSLPFDPAQRDLRTNRAVARFANSNSTSVAA
jgi:hypothetical protein